MAKKKPPKKTTKHYVRLLFISLSVALVVYVVMNFFIKPQYQCANTKSCKSDLSEKIENDSIGYFQGRKVMPPKVDLALDTRGPTVLGEKVAKGEKHIYVDLSTQTLYAYQGNTEILQAKISSGKWGKTPVGNFHIWQKLRATRMAGGEGADAYDLPNIQYVMYFFRDFGLHQAYWHNNFGHPMSHGCVNMRLVDVRDLYNWADGPTRDHPGTPVSVCNKINSPNKCIQEGPLAS